MARPRTVSDERILAATSVVVAREGPIRFTLAGVAAEVGVTAAAIVQRFGSKRALLLALVERGAQHVRNAFMQARANHASSPVDALLAALEEMAATLRSPRETANALAFLQLDISDPEFRALTAAYFTVLHEEVRGLLREALRAKEIRCQDVDHLARAVVVAYNGALIVWAVRWTGSAMEAVREDVAYALQPYRVRRKRIRAPDRARDLDE